MKELENNLLDILQKSYDLTLQALKCVQKREFETLAQLLSNRERAFNIVESLSENIALHHKNGDHSKFNNQVNQLINNIQSIDDIVMECLEHEKDKTQFEIAKTFKNKENFKGYNLNSIK